MSVTKLIRMNKKPSLPPSPTALLPLSPISNPAASPLSTPRKRQRTMAWNAPDYIPDFLPPFPGQGPSAEVEDGAVTDGHSGIKLQPRSPSPPRRPIPLPRATTSTSNTVSDYRHSIPYSSSSLASVNESHLPIPPRHTPPLPNTSTQPSLLAAYSVLQGDVGQQQPSTNPSRIRIANVLASVSSSRYTAPDTLFTTSDPPPPRFPAPIPSHAIPIDPTNTLPLPPPALRPVTTDAPFVPTPPYLHSTLPTLSRHILTPSILSRITRLAPPPPLMNTGSGAGTPVVYKRPIHAPWNRQAGAAPEDLPVVADAVLHSTWDWESRPFSMPLKETKRGKTIMLRHPKMEAADGR